MMLFAIGFVVGFGAFAVGDGVAAGGSGGWSGA